ncbi:hypothetical protein AA984_14130 [Brevibacillus formosus]|uniref:Uncharacterized protein n=2 Tax=Brevibacillus formosus TaxID=54913 RepID=A0A837KM70_9BACL|nr:hypothetical protein AA984_14130 [Brevibacillus formosus]PSJ96457.1 hypothetical protein C7R91_11940 [Brevibacillus formosus]
MKTRISLLTQMLLLISIVVLIRMIQPIAETIRMETGASCKFETSAYSNIQLLIKQQWTSYLRKSTFTTFYGTVGLRKKIPLGSAKNNQIMPDGKKKGKLHL